MDDIEKILIEVKEQEETLIFDKFDSFDALAIGLKLEERAIRKNKIITIHISLNRRVLFHFAFPETSPDNDNWVRRKENTVYHFFKSSYYMENKMLLEKSKMSERFGLGDDYVAAGGGFPITIKGTGVVGCIIVSGMKSSEDHQYIVDAIKDYQED